MDRDDAILDYLQDRLAPGDRVEFEKTLAEDASLAAEVSLMRSVRADLASAPKHQNAEAVWDRLSATIDPPPQPANENRGPRMQVLRYAAVAVIAVAAWQFTVVPRLEDAPGGFRAASEQSEGFVLQVKFVETATIGEITALLGPLEGSIVDGPGALGLVKVSFADAQRRQQAMDEFSAGSDLIDFVLEE